MLSLSYALKSHDWTQPAMDTNAKLLNETQENKWPPNFPKDWAHFCHVYNLTDTTLLKWQKVAKNMV